MIFDNKKAHIFHYLIFLMFYLFLSREFEAKFFAQKKQTYWFAFFVEF